MEPGFEKFVGDMLSESTILSTGYSTLVASIFGTVVGEHDLKKAAYGILYHNRTVTRPSRLGKTIVKGENVTCNVPELLAVVEAMEAAIGWGEGAITIRSRKKYVVDGITKYANKPSRDRRVQRSHENIWVHIEDMSEICEIAAIHIEKWTADAFILRSRDEADQGLVCARSRMSQTEALPAAILVRIVDDEGKVLTERANLSQILIQSMPQNTEKAPQTHRVNTRSPKSTTPKPAAAKLPGKERVKRKTRSRSVAQTAQSRTKIPRSHSAGKGYIETPLPSSSDEEETRYISPIRPAAWDKVIYPGEPIVIVPTNLRKLKCTGNSPDSPVPTRNGGKRTRNSRTEHLSDEEDSHWGKIRKSTRKSPPATQDQLSQFNIATQQMQLALSQSVEINDSDATHLEDAQITHISIHCRELQLADREVTEELNIDSLTITSTPLPPHASETPAVYTTPRKHHMQGVEQTKGKVTDTPVRRSTRIKKPTEKMAGKSTAGLFTSPTQSLEAETGYHDMTGNLAELSGGGVMTSWPLTPNYKHTKMYPLRRRKSCSAGGMTPPRRATRMGRTIPQIYWT